MTEKQAIDRILSVPKTDITPTLARIRKLLRKLGSPQDSLKFIHVAGTNGKGSISTMIASALTHAGIRTGLFTSPYINDFKERFIIDGAPVDSKIFTDFAEAVFFAAGNDEYSQFELITAIGMLIFAHEGCGVTVLECGLGGRFDATNVIAPPIVSVIGQIGYDHMQILGNTIERIATEKSKIIKNGTYATVIAPQTYPESYRVFEGEAFLQNVPLKKVSLDDAKLTQYSLHKLKFDYKDESYTSSLVAKYQLNNCITAIEALKAIDESGALNIGNDAIHRGIAHAYIPARLEVICRRPTVILDGAHNADGMRALHDSLTAIGKERLSHIRIIVGLLEDKNPDTSLRELLRGDLDIAEIITVTPKTPRACPCEKLAAIIREITDSSAITVTAAGSPEDGLYRALTCAGERDNILCCGSLYMMGVLRRTFNDFMRSTSPHARGAHY